MTSPLITSLEQAGEGSREWPLRTPERALLVCKMRELAVDYPRYAEVAQDVAEGRACEIPSWVVLDLLKATNPKGQPNV